MDPPMRVGLDTKWISKATGQAFDAMFIDIGPKHDIVAFRRAESCVGRPLRMLARNFLDKHRRQP
jgi:hypothetical protein